ncbi:DUF2357 domain-containing protein [Treponema sp. OMZ 857]|uniref:DUF2357 domain-containing protein n=1 Tax=Treponema sp. OMZ 857 TaxID=1643513 RepID=UPI0020A3D132|nr:DUF2357 domain-containing protein [Treponema sp. OMZ 857]UTC42739.1 DUF2357 domain-containing protein [Treponema sp. OMZ 857]
MDKETRDYSTLLKSLTVEDSKEKLLLSLRDWYYRIIETDPETGDPLDTDLTALLDKLIEIKSYTDDKNVYDWIFNIFSYSKRGLFHIFEAPRKEILRFHEQMPVYQAREIDSMGIIDISRRPGRTVREKIAAKPSVIAVKRQQSVDTLENRLLKKLIIRATYILEERLNIFTAEPLQIENEDSELSILYSKLCKWLKSDEAQEIGMWQNLPPNNILLCDKYYKKVWATWRYILELTDIIENDMNNIDKYVAVYIFWKTSALLQQRKCKIKQLPVKFSINEILIETIGYGKNAGAVIEADDFKLTLKDNIITFTSEAGEEHSINIAYNYFEIDGKKYPDKLLNLFDANKIAGKLANSISHSPDRRIVYSNNTEEQIFTVMDFSSEYYYGISNTEFINSKDEAAKPYPLKLLRQFWKADDSSELINVDCAASPSIHKDRLNNYKIDSISFDDILYDSITRKEVSIELKTEATYNFMNSIRDYYNTNNFYYILPDYLEDFSLGLIRSTANSVFTNANPTPSSIGAVFAFQHSNEFPHYAIKDNDFVFVIEKKEFAADKKLLSITPITAKTTYKQNEKTEEINLKSIREIPGGVRWEHHPPVVISDYKPSKIMEYILAAVKNTEDKLDSSCIYIISGQDSIKDARLKMPNPNWTFINIPFKPIHGIASFVKLHHRISDIPLWSEHLPNVQMTVIKKGRRHYINLTNEKTVLPIRGKAQEIPISETFILNKNVKEYHFRLVRSIGKDTSALKYEACLTNSAFPLKADTSCELKMYYTYGQEQPFDLYFVSINSSNFVRAKVQWKEIDETKFPVPNFPPERTWSEFINWKDSRSNTPRNLVEWEENNFNSIIDLTHFYADEENKFKRYTCNIPSNFTPNYHKDIHGYYFVIKLNETEYVKIYQTQFKAVENCNSFSFSINTKHKPKFDDGVTLYSSIGLTKGISLSTKLISSFIRRYRFPTMQIWNFGHSIITNTQVPIAFKEKFNSIKQALKSLLYNHAVQEQEILWNELFLYACILHKDCLDISSDLMKIKLQETIDFEQHWKIIEQKIFQFGYFIGDANTPIQKKVFDWALDLADQDSKLNSFKLQILTIALWRCEHLLSTISITQMETVFNQVIDGIKDEYHKLKQEISLSNRKLNPLRSHLELLCALIRSRRFGIEYQQLFSPFNSRIQQLISDIEHIYAWLNKNSKELFAKQIKFTLSDSKSNNNFIDYLLLWLDGENSTEMPKVESATDDATGEDEELPSDDDDE